MGKIYGKLFSIFLLSLVSMSFYVSALPNGAASCDMDTNEIDVGHGSNNLKGPSGYTLTVMKVKGTFQFTLNGPNKGFKGVLAYVVDGSGKKKLGEFTDLPDNIKFKDCDGLPKASVTHTSDAVKLFPFSLTWNAPQGTTGNLTVKALVVREQTSYARLDGVQIDPVSGASSAPTGNLPANAPPQDTTQSDGFLQKYSLFLVMAGTTTLLYVVGSVTEAMLKRQ